jgi:sugar-phosphatase
MSARISPTVSETSFPVEIAVAGLLFDMDGVLVRSVNGDERCWIRWATKHNLVECFDLRRTHGRRAADTIREHLPELDDVAIAEHLLELDVFSEEEQSDVTVYPGVHALLGALPQYRWTVVSSASEKIMRSRLAAVGIVAPRHAVGGDSVAQGKPHPEAYLRGAAILSRQPEECLVIEDAPAGIRAAKAARCPVLAIASSHRVEELQEADWIVRSLDLIQVSIDEMATLKIQFPAIQRSR